MSDIAAPAVPASSEVPPPAAAPVTETPAAPTAPPVPTQSRTLADAKVNERRMRQAELGVKEAAAKVEQDKAAFEGAKAEWERQTAADRAKWAEFEKTIARAKTHPIEVAEKVTGLAYEKLVERGLQAGAPDPDALLNEAVERATAPVRELEAKLEKEREQTAAERKAALEQHRASQEQAAAAALENFRTEAAAKVKAAGDTYELVNATPEICMPRITALIEGKFQADYDAWRVEHPKARESEFTGQPLSVEAAAQIVEADREEEIKAILTTKKAKGMLASVAPPSAPAPAAQLRVVPPPVPSINNRLAAPPVTYSEAPKTIDEVRRRAQEKLNADLAKQ